MSAEQSFSFTGEIIYWRGPSPFHFVEVPTKQSKAIKELSSQISYGWGVLPVTLVINNLSWSTSLFPKNGQYLVPIKAEIRKKCGLELGDQIKLNLVFQLNT